MPPLSYSIPTPLQYFTALVAPQPGDNLALLEAAACLAQDAYPQLDVQEVLADMDRLLARLKARLPQDAGALQRLRLLNHLFYGELGFSGNLNDYYAPENSYLHSVLHSRRGIPISLAVLWLELAQGIGLNAAGVSFPGHFLVKARVAGGQVVLDPLTGQSLSQEALLERLEPFQRDGAGDEAPPLSVLLQAASAREILARMLRNLKEIHRARRDWELLLAVQERLVVLLPGSWAELRDRGLAHAELGHSVPAMQDLQAYLDNTHGAEDTSAIAALVHALRGAA
ncbi:SirB1 family protein [Melaminivora sp.]|uniref:SirB1 family protein n=1 Tax=Melaminivora sp. TaxID=1933032 RepID=UPI0028ABB485|nr:tetratricopeptide repeat protein [Melaminivora sp.]